MCAGCCIADSDGTPTIMYTGVRLRSNPDCGPLPPQECDLNLPFIESQLIAVPESGAQPVLTCGLSGPQLRIEVYTMMQLS